MQLSLLAIGKLKPGPEQDLCADYETRIAQLARRAGLRGMSVAEFAESRAAQVQQRKDDEANRLLAALPVASLTIVFDEHGKPVTSEAFAALISAAAAQGTAHMGFLIGGPDGHGAPVLRQATHKLALGHMTWPHRLARIMVLEQIYRSVTIMTNHPYHRP